MRSPRTAVHAAALLVAIPTLLAFPGCTKATEVAGPARLLVVQGQLQTAAVGTVLPTPVILRALDTEGKPVSGVPISFSVVAGGGTIDPPTSQSDANGEVKAKWTLGPSSPAHTVAAAAPGVEAVLINAFGVMPVDMIVAQGNNQTAKVSTALSVPIVLRIVGANNVPIPNQMVSFAITAGGGALTPASAPTNALGEVTVRWTLGPTAGVQTATATSGTIGPIMIQAVAQ